MAKYIRVSPVHTILLNCLHRTNIQKLSKQLFRTDISTHFVNLIVFVWFSWAFFFSNSYCLLITFTFILIWPKYSITVATSLKSVSLVRLMLNVWNSFYVNMFQSNLLRKLPCGHQTNRNSVYNLKMLTKQTNRLRI